MALYKVEINNKVRKKDLASIPSKDIGRIVEQIKDLASDPYPIGAVRLKGREEWRIQDSVYS